MGLQCMKWTGLPGLKKVRHCDLLHSNTLLIETCTELGTNTGGATWLSPGGTRAVQADTRRLLLLNLEEGTRTVLPPTGACQSYCLTLEWHWENSYCAAAGPAIFQLSAGAEGLLQQAIVHGKVSGLVWSRKHKSIQ
jgi:hypothetical protein